MSTAAISKSKLKDKFSTKAGKEQQKVCSGSANSGGGSSASAYNPISGTFHALETAPVGSSLTFQNGGRFRNIEDKSDNASSTLGTGSEYDSVSNNGSCSGESEDAKEKAATTVPKPDPVPGCDIEKREKIRHMNEKKHQRHKERRAQELHDRCCGYLMSRKLEVLSQQLVAMGFSSERSTLALILNEGKLEESVAWLFDASEQETQSRHMGPGKEGKLKIDIREELAQVAAMEVTYKCSKQEAQRAVVACEGDLRKAEETLKAQKQEQQRPPPKLEGAPETANTIRPHERPMPRSSHIVQQRSEQDLFNPGKFGEMAPVNFDLGKGHMQASKICQPKLMDKRWPIMGSSPPVSYSLASPMQLVPASSNMKAQQSNLQSVGRNISNMALREPVTMMQLMQSINGSQRPVSSVKAPSSDTIGWYPHNIPGIEIVKSSGNFLSSQSRGNLNQENLRSQQFNYQAFNKQYATSSNQVDNPATGLEGLWSSMCSPSPSLAFPSSLGLFSGWGSTGKLGSSHEVDWNTRGSIPNCDYSSIDWTLEANSSSSKANGLCFGLGLSSLAENIVGSGLAGKNGMCMPEFCGNRVSMEAPSSPLAGYDIFRVSRQFASLGSVGGSETGRDA